MPKRHKATARQRRAAGVALAAKRGKIPKSRLRRASKQMEESMTEEQLRAKARKPKRRKRGRKTH
jgi:hypothetical protein